MAQEASEVKHVIGVMSGKGGVGKSLVTALLATALRKAGNKVGIMDADVTGPSIPRLFGLSGRPEISELGIFPVETAGGIEVISVNLLLERPDDAVIWRGPILSNTVKQFWQDVFWGKLDYLLIDLPPGTSDVPLTVMQMTPIEAAVIVTSPQDLAAMVVRKAVNMCRKMGVPVLGMVQNMAYMNCPDCGGKIYPFGNSSGEKLASEMGVPYLQDIAIDPAISSHADAGKIEEYEHNPFAGKADLIENALAALSGVKEGGACGACNNPDRQ